MSLLRVGAGMLAGGIVALGACASVEEKVTTAVGNTFAANLTGANEVPPADPDGVGTARISIDDATNRICTHLEVRNISAVTAAHIHRGVAGVNGPPVVNLDPPDDNDSDDCDNSSDALIDEFKRNTAGFYVNVHTADYPNGAIRGQVVNVKG